MHLLILCAMPGDFFSQFLIFFLYIDNSILCI